MGRWQDAPGGGCQCSVAELRGLDRPIGFGGHRRYLSGFGIIFWETSIGFPAELYWPRRNGEHVN